MHRCPECDEMCVCPQGEDDEDECRHPCLTLEDDDDEDDGGWAVNPEASDSLWDSDKLPDAEL